MQLNKNHTRKICPSIEYVGVHSAKSIKLGNKNVIAFLCATPRTVGEKCDFWLFWTSLIFQVISCDFNANVLKHLATKILFEIKRYFKFVL